MVTLSPVFGVEALAELMPNSGLEAVFYRTIIFGAFTADFPLVPYHIMSAVIRRKSPAFFRHDAVRYLLVFTKSSPQRPQELQSILSVCTGVEDLWIDDVDNALIPLIQSLPLKHLYGLRIPAIPNSTYVFAFNALAPAYRRRHEIAMHIRRISTDSHASVIHRSILSDGAMLPVIHRILAASGVACLSLSTFTNPVAVCNSP
ncbi:hypothetical protein C8R45DRAFT_1107921 [Mycena sanguinolenta]|nr:hypothetical protein C8R45DRAFT_1107921 [Mycena sanguinolenta]